MRNNFKEFWKKEAALAASSFDFGDKIGSAPPDNSLKIPYESFIMIQGDPGAGTTALALEMAEILSADKIVLYFDLFSSVLSQKISTIKSDTFILCNLWDFSPQQVIEVIQKFYDYKKDLILFFDNADSYHKLWRSASWSFDTFVKRVKVLFPEITLIASEKRPRDHSFWPTLIKVERLNPTYLDLDGESVCIGHLVQIHENNKPLFTSFIDYHTGRFSKAFDFVRIQIAQHGKTSGSKFELDGVEATGAWQFVYKYGKKIRDGL